ncbi:reverse transcriptase domain-containing protein [Tanacetum coccineum]
MPNTRSRATMTREVVNELIGHRVAKALEAREAAINLEPLVEGGGDQEEENGDDYEGGNGGVNGNGGQNGNGGNGNGGGNGSGNDNGNGNGNGGGNGYNFGGFMLKIETELWNLTVKGNDLTTYIGRFQELVLLCTRMVPDEEDKVERFIGGLLDNIQGNVIVVVPTRL